VNLGNQECTFRVRNSFNSALLDAIKCSDAIIVLGLHPTTDIHGIHDAIVQAVKENNARVVYMHPLEDNILQNMLTQYVKYEVGSEEGVIAMLAKTLLMDVKMNEEDQTFLNDLDDGYLCAESNVGDDEFENIKESLFDMKHKSLIIGSDLVNHERVQNIVRLAALIEAYTDFTLISDFDHDICVDGALEDIAALPEFNGTVVYRCNSNKELECNDSLRGSSQFALAARINDGDKVEIQYKDSTETRTFVLDKTLKGTIALSPTFDREIEAVNGNYRFEKTKILRIGS